MKKLLLFITALMPVFVCSSTYAIEKENGIYQIGTAQDFRDFAEIVNDGEVTANAVLTADINKGSDATMIGRDGLDYQGTSMVVDTPLIFTFYLMVGKEPLFSAMSVHTLLSRT